ncbi:hypothetical protein [Sphingobacterium bovistauri]|uniref:PKD-like domain-containing protein n=1 Tax=Sphingobacterium bovistauri TaxID=2781959 RepID=A0ABS7ZBX3_9SPHI|nr:hypothetical protein [Sphingobacterium bovistauri]MCA5006385.1 hypothetical protein [Sphingobacterium bovistauri]
MKKLFFSLMIAGTLFTFSCSNDKVVEPEVLPSENIKIKLDREIIGVNQAVTYSVNVPNWAGNIVTYKWVITSPSGVIKVKVQSENVLDYLIEEKGEYRVQVYLASSGKEDKATIKFTTINTDFESGIFGDSKEVILKSKFLQGKSPETGITQEYYWPFSTPRPTDVISFKTGNSYEKYYFSINKLLGGSRDLINEKHNTVSNGVLRNFSYTNYLNVHNHFKGITGVYNDPVIQWRFAATEVVKIKYETTYATKYDGYGWAIMNKDITQVTSDLSSSIVEAKGYLKSMGDNSFYEYHFAIRKK